MTDRPILFSAPMVLAILDGRKTVTRRLVKDAGGAFWDHAGYRPTVVDGRVRWHCVDTGAEVGPGSPIPTSPYGVPGDRLWVKETWSPWSDVLDCDEAAKLRDARAQMPWACILYGADRTWSKSQPSDNGGRWRSPRFMPRWASRLTLDVVSVRVERLQAITEEDARAEGVAVDPAALASGATHRQAFADLWDSLNAKRAPWASDPWVWRIEFRRAVQP